MVDSQAKVLALTRVKSKLSQPERVRLLLEVGPDKALEEALVPHHDLFSTPGQDLDDAVADIALWTARGVKITSILDSEYPENLRAVHESPALIYSAGHLVPNDLGIAVVGSRSAGVKELSNTDLVAELLVDLGLTVVSGLAKGIDARAHRAALQHGGRTVAVMGTGIDRTYPKENLSLRHQIEKSGGLVLTQFEPGASVSRASFPMRNITMSGYATATIVVTAGENSGTRQQARRALMHGRNVILLAPVVRETTWGKEMKDQPGVFVPETMTELEQALNEIKQSLNVLGISM